MTNLLRLRSRHHLHWSKRYGLKLDPLESVFDGVAWNLSEPTWLFRLRMRLFCYAGAHRCPRRAESVFGASKRYGGHKPQPDSWHRGPDGNRCCSYCGSMHFDDLMAVCRRVPDDERYSIDGTTKSYKFYVRQPGVRNAGEGAIKFYTAHVPPQLTDEQNKIFEEAYRLSHQRMMRKFNRAS